MKIFYPIGAFYPSQLGGPNNTVYWMTKALAKEGLKIEIVTTHRGVLPESGIPFNRWVDYGYGRIKYLRVLHRLIPFRLYLNSIKPVLRTDIVHLTSLFYSGSLIIALTSLVLGKKVVWSVRGELDPSALKFRSPFKKIILGVIGLIKRGITFHGTSDVEIEHIKRQFGNETKTLSIPNYMELPKKNDRINEKSYFIYLGRIHQIKAIDNLIKSLSYSDEFLRSEFVLKIAGNNANTFGDSLKLIVEKNDIEHKVEFLGFISQNEIKQKLLAEAYFLILPSYSENFGNVVIEALAQGTPVIASKGTPWKTLESNNSGFWVENDIDSLSMAISKAVNLNDMEYLNMREQALEHVNRDYNIDNNISEWIKAYNSV